MIEEYVIAPSDVSGHAGGTVLTYKEMSLQPGLSVGITRCQSPADEPAIFNSDNSLLHFNCLLDGNFEAQLGDHSVRLRKGTLNRGFAAGQPFSIPYLDTFTNLELAIQPDVLCNLLGDDLQDLDKVVVRGEFFVEEQEACRRTTAAALQMASLLEQNADNKLLLHAAALEYLHWHLQNFRKKTSSAGNLSLRERRQLEEARAMLLRDLSVPPTIPEIAKAVGLNQFKLKQGFKLLFGDSIYATFQAERMQTAAELLQTHNVTETAVQLGYSNVSHFSAAFKKQFGISPRDARQECQICISNHTGSLFN